MRLANKSDKEAILNFWTVCFGADMRYQNILTATDYPLKNTYVLEDGKEIVSIMTLLPAQWQGKGEIRKGSYVYGVAEAEDCGGAIKGDRIDLYMPTYEDCVQFGRRTCTIYFLGS